MTKRHMTLATATALVLLLLVAGCRAEPDTPLTVAASRGDTAEALAQVGRGADVDEYPGGFLANRALRYAEKQGCTELVEMARAQANDGARPPTLEGAVTGLGEDAAP